MNLNQLSYFVSAVQHGSYAGAARQLYLTPQAIAKAVGDLEREFGVSLTVKAGRGMVQTAAGDVFFEEAEKFLEAYSIFDARVRNLLCGDNCKGSLEVALASSLYRGAAAPVDLLTLITSDLRGLEMTVRRNANGNCLTAVEEDISDIAITYGSVGKAALKTVKLFSRQPTIMISDAHRLSLHDCVSIDDILDEPIALPLDFGRCFPLMPAALANRLDNHEFVELPPLMESYLEFMHRRHGVIFVFEDRQVRSLYSQVKFLPLSSEDILNIPVFLSYKDTNRNPALYQALDRLTSPLSNRDIQACLQRI